MVRSINKMELQLHLNLNFIYDRGKTISNKEYIKLEVK